LLRRNSTSYIELSQGENPENKFQERLMHIRQLRKKHSIRSSTSELMPIESESDNSDRESPLISFVCHPSVDCLDGQSEPATTEIQKDEFSGVETKNNGSLLQKKECQDIETKNISNQSLYKGKHQGLETKHSGTVTNGLSHQNKHPDVETKRNGHDLSHKDNHIPFVSNYNNTNSTSGDDLAIGERVIVNHKDRFIFGVVRFVGFVPSKDNQQIGIELDKPMGKILVALQSVVVIL